MILREPDHITVYTEEGVKTAKDAKVSLQQGEKGLKVFISARTLPLKYIKLRWNFEKPHRKNVKILGDDWERAYGTLEWRGIFPERCMPWYCLVYGEGRTEGFGVATGPSALCFWQYDGRGVTLWIDIRCGGAGVILDGRTLECCEVVFGEYCGLSAYEAGRRFCKAMADKPKPIGAPVYGSNNWYYAYGKFTRADVMADVKQLASLCSGNANRPCMVIDDGWQKYNCDGPWVPKEEFGDLSSLAAEMAAEDVIPGIWTRPLSDHRHETPLQKPAHRSKRDKGCLDPTDPDVLAYVRELMSRLTSCGYKVIKHDYSTFDIFGKWGFLCPDVLTREDFAFENRNITSAEAVKGLYAAIRQGAGDAVIIGCNTISHLSAGVFELYRTGDDTSGFDWDRTRKFGVNTLAFRGIQHKAFYECDADCIGIMGKIPWELNREWLKLLSESGTPLFISLQPGVCGPAELAEIAEALKKSSRQDYECIPLDWTDNAYPERYLINGEEKIFNWYDENPTAGLTPPEHVNINKIHREGTEHGKTENRDRGGGQHSRQRPPARLREM